MIFYSIQWSQILPNGWLEMDASAIKAYLNIFIKQQADLSARAV
jgi:beta-glucosidase/6-phospho-beta-glucosidase/beta-galactosidase